MKVLFDFDIEINEKEFAKKRSFDLLNHAWKLAMKIYKKGRQPKFVLQGSIDIGKRRVK